MTLATVPRYNADRVSIDGEHAVVVGGSVAGLFAARVLTDGFERVTILERDPLPEGPAARDGVPQASHPHALQEAGRATAEDLFPGYGEDLLSAGGLMIDAASDFAFYDEGDFLTDGPNQMPMYAASRPLFEHVLRARVVDCDGVSLRSDCHCTGYRLDEQESTVEGVSIREGETEHALNADLVVDATGRASRTPTWLEKHGFESPAVDEVHVDLAYSTLRVERPPGDRRAFWAPASAPRTRGGGAAPIEGGHWQVVMHGVHGDHPPTAVEEFESFAATLPFSDLERLLGNHSLVDDEAEYYPFPSNRRHRYEDLDRFPEGLLVIGDAIASFNPIYGQGISVAALESLVLHNLLVDGSEELGRRFFDQAGEVIDIPWTMAVGADFQFAETTGPKPRGTDLFGGYLSRLTRKAHTDGEMRDVLFRVIMMEVPPTALLRPGIVWQVLKPTWPGIGPTAYDDMESTKTV